MTPHLSSCLEVKAGRPGVRQFDLQWALCLRLAPSTPGSPAFGFGRRSAPPSASPPGSPPAATPRIAGEIGSFFAEVRIDPLGQRPAHPVHLQQILHAGSADPARGPERVQQRPLAPRSHPVDFVQGVLLHFGGAFGAVGADGEAVGFVAQALEVAHSTAGVRPTANGLQVLR